MSILAVVHYPADLARACEDLSAFLSFHYSRPAASETESLLGIWLEPAPAPEDAAGSRGEMPQFLAQFGTVRESVSLGGVWTLYWLESGQVERLPLLETLMQPSPADAGNGLSRRFIPVFPDDMAGSDIQSELARLQRQRPSFVMPPLWQDRQTRRISLPPDYPELCA